MFDCSLDFSTLSLTANDLFAEMGYGNTAPEEPVEALALSMLKEVFPGLFPVALSACSTVRWMTDMLPWMAENPFP